MRVNRKNIISIILVLILLIPTIIKFFDGIWHHHHHKHPYYCYTESYSQNTDKCPIPSIEFSVFNKTDNYILISITKTYVILNSYYKNDFCCNNSRINYLSRAPPY